MFSFDLGTYDPRVHAAEVDAIYGLDRQLSDWILYPGEEIPLAYFSPGNRRYIETLPPIQLQNDPQSLPHPLLEKLLARVHPADEDILRRHLRLQSTSRVGRELGITQPSACARLAMARKRLRLAQDLPDLTFEEVLRDVQGVLPRRAASLTSAIAAFYWLPVRTIAARLYNVPQSTHVQALHDVQRRLGPKHPLSLMAEWPIPQHGPPYRGGPEGIGASLLQGRQAS